MSALDDIGFADTAGAKRILRQLDDKKARRNLIICGKLAEVRDLLDHRVDPDTGAISTGSDKAVGSRLGDAASLAGAASEQPVNSGDVGEQNLLLSVNLLLETVEVLLVAHGYGVPSSAVAGEARDDRESAHRLSECAE